jgi:hypothetical protein
LAQGPGLGKLPVDALELLVYTLKSLILGIESFFDAVFEFVQTLVLGIEMLINVSKTNISSFLDGVTDSSVAACFAFEIGDSVV